MSWRLRKDCSWLVRLLPAAVLAPVWTFAWQYDTLVWTLPVMFFAQRFLAGKPGWFSCLLCIAAATAVAVMKSDNWGPTPGLVRYSVDIFKLALFAAFVFWFKEYARLQKKGEPCDAANS